MIVPRLSGRAEQAKVAVARSDINANIATALKLYQLDNGNYPTTEQGLEALVQKPTVGRIPNKYKDGGYLDGGNLPLDPWGNNFVYMSPGIHNREYDIESYGPDGEDGGEGENEDIESWNLR